MNEGYAKLTLQAAAGRFTYYNVVIVTENHLRFIIGRHIRANV